MLNKHIEPFMKYIRAGGLATLVHYAIFLTIMQATPYDAWQATLIAATVGALAAYLLNYHYTFFSTKKHHTVLPKFLVVAAVGVIIQTFIVALLNQYWLIHYLPAQIVATGSGLVLTFFINSFWTFK